MCIFQLKAKEVEKIKTLTEEWRKRDKEREILTKKKVDTEYYTYTKKKTRVVMKSLCKIIHEYSKCILGLLVPIQG